MIDTILFDLDNTILDFNKAESVALSKTLIELEIEPTDLIINRYSEINLSQWKLLELGELTRPQVKEQRFRILFDELGIEYDIKRTQSVYEELLGIGHFFVDGAPELLEKLNSNYKLYIVTNGTLTVQETRIASAGIKKYFKDIFVSEEVGFNKPSKEYFDYCTSRIENFNKETTIIIGDSITSDIQGGKNAGIKTVWFNQFHDKNNSDIIPDFEIDKLSDLEEIIHKL